MSKPVKTYRGDGIDVTYDVSRCIHAAECVRGLPAVFDTKKRPWIQPDQAEATAVAEVVGRCPTGALQVAWADGRQETAPEQNRIALTCNGPLYLRGVVEIVAPDGSQVIEDTRLALCRCGQSANKPFCDNAHKEAGFVDDGNFQAKVTEVTETAVDGRLKIIPSTNGPLLLRGNFEIVSADGQSVFRGEKAALCRCGGSRNKPFCDGSHKRNGFQTE